LTQDPGVPYQQLLRGPRFSWWRAVLVIALTLAFTMAAFTLVTLAMMALGLEHHLDAMLEGEQMPPVAFGIGNLVLASLIPFAMLSSRIVHGRGAAGRLSSVAGRIRWNWLLRCMALLTPLFALYVGLDLLLDPPGDSTHPEWALLLVLILFTTPLQAAGEEYFARGLILQNVGSFFADRRLAAVAAAVPSVLLFAAAHGSADTWIFLDLAISGAACTVLALRTGGLEAPIALHAINNMVGMIATVLIGGWNEGFVAPGSEGQPLEPLLTLVACGIAVPLILGLAARQGLQCTRTAAPEQPRRATGETIALLATLALTAWAMRAMLSAPA
jgi:membrane protease YdiL (CAAX protease family)